MKGQPVRRTWDHHRVRVTQSLVLCVCFRGHCLSFCPLSFSHCAVCPASICGFSLTLWYLQILLLKQKLLKQVYVPPRLKSSLQKFYDSHHNLVCNYEISNNNGYFAFQEDVFIPLSLPGLLTNLIVCMNNTVVVFKEAGTVYPSWTPEFSPGFFWWGMFCSSS